MVAGVMKSRDDERQPLDAAAIATLIDAAVAGDRPAFETLYRAHVDRVYGLCLRLTADRERAETLTQDTFVRAWYALGGFKNDGQFSAWLGRIATNLWRDRFRSSARRRQLLADLAGEGLHTPSPTEPPVVRDGTAADVAGWLPGPAPGWSVLTAIELERAVGRLPAGARTVFVLHDVEGYKHREIAELLDVTVGTVKAQVHRARLLLRGLLTQGREAANGA